MYEVYDANRKCLGCFWRSAYEHLVEDDVKRGQYVKIYDTFGELSFIIKDYDELIEYRECVARAATWGKQIAGTVASKVKMKPKEVTTFGPFAQGYGALGEAATGVGLSTLLAAATTIDVSNIGAPGTVNSIETTSSFVKQLTPEKDHINPDHYKEYMPDLQWLEAMQYLPRFKNKPDVFAGAVELQIRKYLDRNGGKDEEIQELSKALWYMKFLVAYLKEGKPIRIEAINKILEG